MPGVPSSKIAHQLTKQRGALEKPATLLCQHAASLGDGNALSPPREKRHVEVALELLHMSRHSRLGVVERLSGSTERPVADNRMKRREVSQLHPSRLYHDFCTICSDHFA
jgi:hypothetical protein